MKNVKMNLASQLQHQKDKERAVALLMALVQKSSPSQVQVTKVESNVRKSNSNLIYC